MFRCQIQIRRYVIRRGYGPIPPHASHPTPLCLPVTCFVSNRSHSSLTQMISQKAANDSLILAMARAFHNSVTQKMETFPAIDLLAPLPQTFHLPNAKEQHVEHIEHSNVMEAEEQLPVGITETTMEKEEQWFIGSIDQGTTSSRFLIFNGEGVPVASHQIEFENMYPESG